MAILRLSDAPPSITRYLPQLRHCGSLLHGSVGGLDTTSAVSAGRYSPVVLALELLATLRPFAPAAPLYDLAHEFNGVLSGGFFFPFLNFFFHHCTCCTTTTTKSSQVTRPKVVLSVWSLPHPASGSSEEAHESALVCAQLLVPVFEERRIDRGCVWILLR